MTTTNTLSPVEKVPLLSLAIICGNEGAKTLARLLKSALIRPGGPMFDEVVIAWNGRDDALLIRALTQLASALRIGAPLAEDLPHELGETREVMDADAPIRVLRQEWRDNFAIARQESFEAACGTWRCYLDCDDVCPIWDDVDGPDGRKAIEASLRWCGVDPASLSDPVGPPKTRQDYLRALDPSVNVVEFPYDYTIGGDGQALWRYWRRRIVRWADGWIWREQLNFHEDIFPVGGCVPKSVRDGGLPIRHYPSEDVHERTARNRAILNRMLDETKRGLRPVDGRLLYNMATFELQSGNWLAAEQLLDQAIRATQDDADMRLYRHCRGKALIALGRHAEAVYEAAALVGHDAEAYEGWALYTECAYNRGEWRAVTEYGYHAIQGKVRADATDKPVEREAHLRVMMATAWARLGNYEDALHLAEEAIERAPQDAFSKDAAKRIRGESAVHDAAERALALAAYHVERRDALRVRAALDALPHSEAIRRDLRVLALKAKLEALVDAEVGCGALSIFRAPSPWARFLGSLLLAESRRPARVLLRGCVHLDDVKALREIVPEVEWFPPGETPPEDDKDEVIASVDLAHTFEGGGRCEFYGFVTFPAPEVEDHQRKAVLGLLDAPRLAGPRRVRELRLITPPRPDSDVARVVMMLGGDAVRTRVDFFCPHWAEAWGPDALTDSGCGGSEEAVIYLTRELAKKGYEPHVYGPWRPAGGLEVRGGVWWHDIRDFDPRESQAPVVAHRAPWVCKDAAFGGRVVYVWHHDHEYNDATWTAEIAKAARHLFVSKWQEKQLLAQIGLEPGAVHGAVIGNGVPREEFDLAGRTSPPRDPRRVFYASQPHRGLAPLLHAWPKVLEAEPEAVLDVYYGWQTVEALARSSQPQLWAVIREIDGLLRTTPRVNVVGRLPQSRLSEEMRRSGVWAYPCAYPEVFAIIGARAAAAGCALVYTKFAALPETMPDDTFALDPKSATTDDLAAMIVKAIRDRDYPRDNVARLTLSLHSWEAVAERVAALFEGRT